MAGLSSILKLAAPIVGGVVGGPAGAAIGSGLAGTLGSAGSDAAGGMATERGGKNVFNASANAADTSRYGIEQGAAANLAALDERALMDRANLGLTAPTARANQVMKGSLMSMLKPSSVSHPRAHIPEMSGGLTSILSDPALREAGMELKAQAGDALRTKSDVPAAANYSASARVEAPKLREYEDPGKLETTLGLGGNIAKIIAALAQQGMGRTGGGGAPEMDWISRAGLGL